MNTQKKAYIFSLSAILCWSTVATAFKIALNGMDFLHLLLISSGVAMLFLGSLLLFTSQLKKVFSGNKRDYIRSAGLGFLNPFLYYLVLLKAYSIIPEQFALSLNYIWSITLVLLSIPLLQQKIGWKSILCILLSFSGVLIIANKDSLTSIETPNAFGVLLALFSSLFWSLFWIFNVRDHREEKEKLFLSFVFSFLYILISILLFSDFQMPDNKSILAAIYIGIIECGIAYVFWLKALKITSSTDKISNLVFLSPFIFLLFVYLIIGESIYLSILAGLVLIILRIILRKIIKNFNPIE